MSERFVRCSHCGQNHEAFSVVCPATGKPMRLAPRAPFPSEASHPSAPTNPIARHDLLGATIGGKYVVRAILGEGGMGTVYEAQHLTIGRSVAVKVLHPKQMRKRESVKRFHHEARAAGAIGHPNICEVYDLGTLEDGRPYLVMEKLVGKTLADRIKEEGGLPFADVADILTQVLSGLVVAHAKGILHRDIKPENVFLTERVGCPPVAKLLDFGVSKMVSSASPLGDDDENDLTRTGMVMGTPYYMSPEQARGDRNLDARVDMYACGVLCYEAVTAKRPFTANNYNSLLLQILSGKPRPARELRPDLPSAFSRIIERAMSRRREDRYQSAAEFQHDLGRLRVPVEAPRRSPPRPPPIVELPSDALATPSSVDIPVVIVDDSHGGVEEIITERLKDFSLSDEDDAATTLMRNDEIERLARSARQSSGMKRASPAVFDANASDLTTTAVRRPDKRGKTPEPYNADETVKTDPREALKGRAPGARRSPKAPR